MSVSPCYYDLLDSLRLYDHDFKGIQKKALQMGIPYQTLISGVIHRYIEGDLISKEG